MREKIVEMIAQSLKSMQEEMKNIKIEDEVGKTPLYGAKGTLTSLDLVRLLVDVEEKVRNSFRKDIVIADEKAMSQKVSPFISVGSLARYIHKLIKEEV